jgi:sialate O-acetylesterase
VGHRLALAARARVYGEQIEYCGPVFGSLAVEGNRARVKFTHLGGGLLAGSPEGALIAPPDEAPKPGAETLVGFAVAGADKVFHWAEATISGDTVLLTCPQVARPVAVRYAWADNPACNLYSRAGLPALPFRTDDW